MQQVRAEQLPPGNDDDDDNDEDEDDEDETNLSRQTGRGLWALALVKI